MSASAKSYFHSGKGQLEFERINQIQILVKNNNSLTKQRQENNYKNDSKNANEIDLLSHLKLGTGVIMNKQVCSTIASNGLLP